MSTFPRALFPATRMRRTRRSAALRALKAEFPDLAVMNDIALDPYTTHGQDGINDDTGYVLNDETVETAARRLSG